MKHPSFRFPIKGYKTVLGQLGSKSNGRRPVRRGSKFAFIKSDTALQYVSDFEKQIPKALVPFEGPVMLYARCYYKDRRRDLDVALLQDCIQKREIIKNDRQIECIIAFRHIDKKRPRVEFFLKSL